MFRLIAINFSQKSPTSLCELSEREVTSPSNLKVYIRLLKHALELVVQLPVHAYKVKLTKWRPTCCRWAACLPSDFENVTT
jgi:hypothetical protein